MASYRDKYGSPDPRARGPLAPFLGDPTRFKQRFETGDYLWLATEEANTGNAFMILGSQTDGSSVYDFHFILHEDTSGARQAADIFGVIESGMSAQLGLDLNSIQGIDYPSEVNDQDPSVLYVLDSGAGNTGFDTIHGNFPATIENAQDLCHSTVVVTLPGVDGHSFVAVCWVNLWLRIGYIQYIVGPPLMTAPWAAALQRTLTAIVAIVVAVLVAVFTLGGSIVASVGVVISSVINIVSAWYTFDEEQKKLHAADDAKGKSIILGGGSITQKGLSGLADIIRGLEGHTDAVDVQGVAPAPDWVDWILGT